MQNLRQVSLLTSGQEQVLTIPPELALSSTEVLLRKEGHRLIIEPISSGSLISLLTTLPDLLDTNILSHLIRYPQGQVFQHIVDVGEESVCTSIIVACELRFGVVKSGSSRLVQQLERILEFLTVLPLESTVDKHYALIRKHLEQAGTPIGPNDLLIAAHSLALDLTLVTANTREFERVPALKLENWLIDSVIIFGG